MHKCECSHVICVCVRSESSFVNWDPEKDFMQGFVAVMLLARKCGTFLLEVCHIPVRVFCVHACSKRRSDVAGEPG